MNDDCRKRLTGFLGECWNHFNDGTPCPLNRTFTTEADMMALYRRLVVTGGWDKFTLMVAERWRKETNSDYEPRNIRKDFTAWLLCLSGEGYEERCEMVDEFLEEG